MTVDDLNIAARAMQDVSTVKAAFTLELGLGL